MLNTGEYFHGTSPENGQQIVSTDLWLPGSSKPRGVWLTPDFNYAKKHAGQGCWVLLVRVAPYIHLTQTNNIIYVLETPGIKANEQYCHIRGLEILQVYDENQNVIL